jgi:hypothetical protein
MPTLKEMNRHCFFPCGGLFQLPARRAGGWLARGVRGEAGTTEGGFDSFGGPPLLRFHGSVGGPKGLRCRLPATPTP